MVRVGALDHPVERSSHTAPTPKGGGVGIVAAYVAGMAWLAVFGRIAPHAVMVMPAALLLAIVSYADDFLTWPF
jgi:UDP-GlcNAc:undecaprenyl-phosphate GlcNAc-1-phosphate transferase